MSKICIFGSTGSIGLSTLKVVRAFPDRLRIRTLCCNTNIDLLSGQIGEFHPEYAAVASYRTVDQQKYSMLKKKHTDVTFLEGDNPLLEAASIDHDIVVSSLVGAAGLSPTIASIPNCRRLALANKESLVMAGGIVLSLAEKHKTELLPIDSEHSALFMLLEDKDIKDIESLIVTASGGSLRDMPIEDMDHVTPEKALKHPTWNMGKKITIDSATLVNKGFEVIEAHYLFGMEYERINVVLHPQSIVHALVEMKNGSYFAHMGVNDMIFPITNAVLYPDNKSNPFERFKLAACGRLDFREIDKRKYPALELCYDAGRKGGNAPVVLNSANETAVAAFLNRKIKFTDIYRIIEWSLSRIPLQKNPSLEDIFSCDRETRILAEEYRERI